jgi:hypothetical protein
MRQARGQTLVLGALSFLVLALMVTLSFNLSQALRAKISLQQHSDSLAYSMAVMEARALNYYAVTNRTMAASYVAMNSLHAYMAAASVTGQMMKAGSENFSEIAQKEVGMCDENEHCEHAVEAAKIASDYSRAATQYDNKARALEGRFNAAVIALDKMIDELHGSQRSVHERTQGAIRDGMSQGLRALADYNAPGVSGLPDGVGAINAQEFDCSVDGMQCPGGPSSVSAKARAQVMAEVANATRTDWPANRAGLIESGEPQYLHPQFLEELTQGIPGSSILHEVKQHSGTAKLVQRRGALREGGTQKGNEGTTVSADERGTLANEWNDHTGSVRRSYEARVWSDSRSGGHTGSRAHRGTHRFEGTNAKALETCSESGNCFMKFRGNADPQKDWGQSRVYSYVTQSLRIGDPKKAPWELNASAEVSFKHGTQDTTKVTLAPGEGAGLSKALVYYHRFDNADLSGESTPGAEGGWKEPPNLFAPYWRAKLHPLTPQQAQQVLNEAGNSDAAQIVQNASGLSL